MKTVLLHIHQDKGQEARFQAAVDVVRAIEGHLTCLQATPFESYVVGDPFGGIYALPQMIAQLREEEEAERAKFEERLAVEGVSWDWLAYDGSAARMLTNHSRLSDLVVVSQTAEGKDDRNQPPPIAADIALHARCATLVMPSQAEKLDCGGKAVVAWNGSFEASQALRLAIPLLRLASSVEIVTVSGDESLFPSIDASTYLSRHGIGSNLVEWPLGGRSVAESLSLAAAEMDAAYLVLGAYGHSRIRERILGGVTRDMLDNARVPLLLAH